MGALLGNRAARLGMGALLAACVAAPITMGTAALAALPTRPTSMAECLAEGSSATDYGCYEIAVASVSPSKVVLRVSWNLNTTAEGFSNADWKGGVWMQRRPVAGQWPKGKYPKGVEQLPSGKSQELCESAIAAGKAGGECYRTFSGAQGSLDLEFPTSMAGYVYEIQSFDNICSVDGSSCGPSGGSIQYSSTAYAFIVKAFRYTSKQGKKMVGTTCPPAAKRSSSCKATLAAKRVNNIGGGSPVPLSSGS